MPNHKALLISVGGSPNPLIYSLNERRPNYIIFFASTETREQIPLILREIDFQPKAFEQIVTPLAENLSECYKALRKKLPEILDGFKISYQDLIVDYTGGTKTMSAAVVLATIDKSSEYSYVGGTERNKQGLGVVIDGKEKILYLTNPWDELAISENNRINLFFNSARYKSALETIEELKTKVSRKLLPFYQILTDLITGYDLWDRFQHNQAKNSMQKGKSSLRTYVSGADDPKLPKLLSQVEKNAEFLSSLEDKTKKDYLLVADLISNAKRRADLEGKYDDAVARLYRAIEMIAQAKLSSQYEIKTSSVPLLRIPESIREEYIQKYKDKDGKIKVPLQASYRLLAELGDELGGKFILQQDEVDRLLRSRNSSILAHGTEPIKEEIFQKLFRFILDFTDYSEEDLPVFPKLEI